MADHRTILATAAVILFLQSQPGEFTAHEIRESGTGFHSDNDEEDVRMICVALSSSAPRRVQMNETEDYAAFKWKR